MNKKKWERKFRGRDSRRFLKHHKPYYSDPYRPETMPPPESWTGMARRVLERYPRNCAQLEELRRTVGWSRSAESAAACILSSRAQREVDAVETARRVCGGRENEPLFLRVIAREMGVTYHHDTRRKQDERKRGQRRRDR